MGKFISIHLELVYLPLRWNNSVGISSHQIAVEGNSMPAPLFLHSGGNAFTNNLLEVDETMF